MALKLVLLAVVALALLTPNLASAHGRGGGCAPARDDRDWVHHHYAVLEISTTDIVTPSPLFFGTAPLQNGTPPSLWPLVVGCCWYQC